MSGKVGVCMSKVLSQSVEPMNQTVSDASAQNYMQDSQYDFQMAQQSMAALNKQLEEEGYSDENYMAAGGPDGIAMGQYPSTMAQDIAGVNQYQDATLSDQTLQQDGSGVTEIQGEIGETLGSEQSQDFSNLLARFVDKVANFVGKDTSFGLKLSEMAKSLEGDVSGAEALSDQVGTIQNAPQYHDLNHLGQDGISASSEAESALTIHNREVMSEAGREGVNSGFLADIANADNNTLNSVSDTVDDMAKDLETSTVNNMAGVDAWEENSPQKQELSDKHMSFIRGIQSFNDAAKSEIETQFANDPEKMQESMNGLERFMGAVVPKAYDTLYDNNKMFGFLSESDKAELSCMNFEGVMNYADYANQRDMQSGGFSDIGMEDASMYANAGIDDALGVGQDAGSYGDRVPQISGCSPNGVVPGAAFAVSNGSKPGVQNAVDSMRQMSQADRVAAAEERFGDVLDQADTTKSDYDMGR